MGSALCHNTARDTPKDRGQKTVICVAGLASSALEHDPKGKDKWQVTYCSIKALSTHPDSTLQSLRMKLVDGTLSDGTPVKTTAPENDEVQRPVGGMAGLSVLNPGEPAPVAVWKGLVDQFEKDYNLHGYNYDWRRWGDEAYAEEMIETFQEKVEDAIEDDRHPSGKASVIGHSMGCPVILYCLSKLGDDWVRAHIDNVILVGPGSGGSPSMIPSYGHAPFLATIPLPEPIEKLAEGVLGSMCATWACMIAEMPMPIGDVKPWPDDFVFARTPTKQYRLQDIGRFLDDLESCTPSRNFGPALWKGVQRIGAAMKCPPVPVQIVYGTGVDTPEVFQYETEDLSVAPKVSKNSPGDGTIVSSAIEAVAKAWKAAGNEVALLECPGNVSHKALIVSEYALSVFPKLVMNKPLTCAEVTVLRAEGLSDTDWTSKSDPFVVVGIEGKEWSEQESEVIWNTCDPPFNFKCTIHAWEPGDSIMLEIFDWDPGMGPQKMGWAALPSEEFAEDGFFEGELSVEDGDGTLFVCVEVKPLAK